MRPVAFGHGCWETNVKVSVVGAGYVGLVTAACLAEMGNSVSCVDVDETRVALLNQGQVPIHEPGLDALIARNQAVGRLSFVTDAQAAFEQATVIFIAVGTPTAEDGSADVARVLQAAATIGQHLHDYKVIVDKSTVPVGTADQVREVIAKELRRRGSIVPFSVVSNPEFLKEGAAVEDFMRPDRVVIGAEDDRAIFLLRALYAPFLRNRDRILVMDVKSAELTKYAANAMLAVRISFMNELAAFAEHVGADIEQVRLGIGSDHRIGTHFLYAGCGWGGSCFPKDTRALMRSAVEAGTPLPLVTAAVQVNEHQRQLLVRRVVQRFGDNLSGRRIGIWGLAFKAGTDDVREATSAVVVQELLQRGATVQAFDPVAMPNASRQWGTHAHLHMCADPYAAAEEADALVVITEWREFRSPDFDRLRDLMRAPIIFDGRNLYDRDLMASVGFEYVSVGRPAVAQALAAQPMVVDLAA